MVSDVFIYTQREAFSIYNVLWYLRLPWLCLEAVHLFEKRRFFHEIFQVGACPNLKDSSFYEWFSIHVYKAWSNRYRQRFCSICDSLRLYKVHFVWKRWFLVHAPNWKISHYMKGILFICTRQAAICIFNNFPLSATLLCLGLYIFWKKMIFFSWNISSWCMPQLERFLIIWKYFYPYEQDIESSLSSTFLGYLWLPNALQGTLLQTTLDKLIF